MNNPITPELVYAVHSEKVKNLNRELDLLRAAKAPRADETLGPVGQAFQWVQEKLFSRAPAIEEPCPEASC